MEVRTNRASYWVGEPVVARVRIVNWLSPSLTVFTAFDVRGNTQIQIREGQGVAETYYGHLPMSPVTPQNNELPYGKAIESDIVILYSSDTQSHLAFDRPGEYRLQMAQGMRYTDMYKPMGRTGVPSSTRAETEPFQVVAPPEEARPALEILQSDPRALKDLNSLYATPASRSTIERVAREYPDSRYAPYCLHALATLSLALAKDLSGEREKAEEYLTRLIEDYPDYPLRDTARIRMADFLYETGRFNRALGIVQDLVAESEDNMKRFDESRMIKPLIATRFTPAVDPNVFNWYLFGTTELTDAYYCLMVSGAPK